MIVTEEELVRWGRRIGEFAETPLFIALSGPLGAGKSVLARAVARGAGVAGAIPSPTFNLCFQYEADGGRQVVHMDLYRLTSPDELWELGWEEIGAPDDLVLVEWAERAEGLLPDDRWDIQLEPYGHDAGLRRVAVARVGEPAPLPGFPVHLSADDEE